jgi:ATP-dependent Clp protease ATP-binding subunit ClpX
MSKPRNPNASCSFCRKNYRDVGPLVEGPGEVYICGECITLCEDIIRQERRRRRPADESLVVSELAARTKLAHLVPGQDDVREILISAALRHYKRSEQGPQCPVLLIGPTRSSKLYLARALAHALEVPFAEADASSLARAGNRQGLALLSQFLSDSDFDAEAAQRGIVFVDGVDRHATQECLLQLWKEIEGEARRLPVPIKTEKILYLCGGEFAGLDAVVTQQGRHSEQPVTREALRSFGMAADLVNLFATIVKVGPLEEGTLLQMVACVDFSRMANDAETEESQQ